MAGVWSGGYGSPFMFRIKNGCVLFICLTVFFIITPWIWKIQENPLREIKMKLFILLLLMTIFAVASAIPQNLFGRAPLCGNECTVICGYCTCVASNCNDAPFCTIIKSCTGTCSDTCSVTCGDCTFNCVGCANTPPICSTCTRVWFCILRALIKKTSFLYFFTLKFIQYNIVNKKMYLVFSFFIMLTTSNN